MSTSLPSINEVIQSIWSESIENDLEDTSYFNQADSMNGLNFNEVNYETSAVRGVSSSTSVSSTLNTQTEKSTLCMEWEKLFVDTKNADADGSVDKPGFHTCRLCPGFPVRVRVSTELVLS